MDEGAGGEERGLGGAGQKFRSEGRMRDVVRCWTDRPTDRRTGTMAAASRQTEAIIGKKEGGRGGTAEIGERGALETLMT